MLISPADLAELEETLDVLSDPDALADIREADAAYAAAQKELDPDKRAALLIKVNEIFCEAHVILPLLSRTRVVGSANTLQHDHSGWDNDTWNLGAWYRS
mgnify:CR=1 FL=1